MTARFIAFEGGEGSGKSTQARLLAGALDAELTREPGGTVVGTKIRELLLDPATEGLDHRAEALLLAADRAQHVATVVRPALERGRHVVTDRYAGSSIAYQGFGRRLGLSEVRQLSVWATEDLWPDLTILLDVAPSAAAARLGRDLDRFEQEDGGFHQRVVDGFRELAAVEVPTRVVIDGSAPIDVVAEAVREAVRQRLQLDV